MKKLILLLLFIPLVSFGQDVNLNVDKKIEFTEKKDVKNGMGLNYQGSGIYTFSKLDRQGNVNKSNVNKYYINLKTQVVNEIIEFTTRNILKW